MGHDYYEDENPEKTRKVNFVLKIIGFILFLGIIAGTVVGIYVGAHSKSRKHSSSNRPSPIPAGPANHSYPNAMELSIQFFDVQKSGKLPSDYPIKWRTDSAVNDGSDVGLDLSGGLYDAGDHMKFSFPMAFTSTLLAWSVLEYSPQLKAAGQLDSAVDKIRWVADFLVKAHPRDNEFYFQVGDPVTDHSCWERSSDMTEKRPAYVLNTTAPGSDVVGEAAAALAAASLVFSSINVTYSAILVTHAKQLFTFGDTYRGLYSDSFTADQTYYNSTSYGDELLWAAGWLYYATGNDTYMKYVTGDQGKLYAEWGKTKWFSWDQKLPGLEVILSRTQVLHPLQDSSEESPLKMYKETADQLMCALIPSSPTATASRTKGGMIWVTEWSSVQHAVNSAFLAVVYSDYLKTAGGSLSCSGVTYSPGQVRDFAASQADYILGNNPMNISYVVGYGTNYPQFVHHRDASIPFNGIKYSCTDGFDKWFYSTAPNPNVASGALVGGPALNDTFVDSRQNIMQNEPSSYNSGSLVGLLAGLSFSTAGVTSWTAVLGS